MGAKARHAARMHAARSPYATKMATAVATTKIQVTSAQGGTNDCSVVQQLAPLRKRPTTAAVTRGAGGRWGRPAGGLGRTAHLQACPMSRGRGRRAAGPRKPAGRMCALRAPPTCVHHGCPRGLGITPSVLRQPEALQTPSLAGGRLASPKEAAAPGLGRCKPRLDHLWPSGAASFFIS